MHEYKLRDYSINDFHHRLSYWLDWEWERERAIGGKTRFLVKTTNWKMSNQTN